MSWQIGYKGFFYFLLNTYLEFDNHILEVAQREYIVGAFVPSKMRLLSSH